MSQMTADTSNIEFGPCQVTYNGVDLGLTRGGVTAVYTVGWLDQEADQSSMIVDSKVQTERFVITVPMLETTITKLKEVMITGTYTLDSGGVKKKIEFGGKQVADTDFKQLIITPISDGSGTLTTDDNEKCTVYKCVPRVQYNKAYNRDGARVVPVEFHAIADLTKAAGNQLFVLGDTTAAA